MSWAELDGQGSSFVWRSKYLPALVDEFKVTIPYQDRTWNPKQYREPGYWDVAAKHWDTVIALCRKHGLEVSTFGSVQETQATKHTFTLDYMGLVKERSDGSYTSTGHVNGGWNAIFPLAALQEWFNFSTNPGQMPTLFGILGVDQTLTGMEFNKALKKAYRRSARAWHPDVNKEPEAEETFKRIQDAYEKLKDPLFCKRYKAGMHFQQKVEYGSTTYGSTSITWRPPIRCGTLLVTAVLSMDKYAVQHIHNWHDIRNAEGETLITYWKPGDSFYSREWRK